MSRSSLRAKRLLDIVVAVAGLSLLLPLLPVIALAVLSESRGPLFVRHLRAGVQRRRSRPGPDEQGGRRLHDIRGQLFQLVRFRVLGDRVHVRGRRPGEHPQLTRVGRWLRRSRLEGLPQLWNVLRGDMSLVGPRPVTPRFVDRLYRRCPGYQERMIDVSPGILGLAQLHWSETSSFLGNVCEKVLFDLSYAARLRHADWRSALALDLSILRASVLGRHRRAREFGNEVIRIEYPRRFEQARLEPDMLSRRTPVDVGAEVHAGAGETVAWWYPPRSRGLDLPEPDEGLVAELCDQLDTLSPDGITLTKDLRPGTRGVVDVLRIELPRGLHEIHRVAEHLGVLWESLADRADDENFAFTMSLLLVEGLTMAAARTQAPDSRLGLTITVSPSSVRLAVAEQPSEHAGDERTTRLAPKPLAGILSPRRSVTDVPTGV